MTYLWDGHPLEDAPLASCPACAETIVWAVVQASGKRVPLNPQPAANGTVAVIGHSQKGIPFISYDRDDGLPPGDEAVTDDRYARHRTTCEHSRRRSR